MKNIILAFLNTFRAPKKKEEGVTAHLKDFRAIPQGSHFSEHLYSVTMALAIYRDKYAEHPALADKAINLLTSKLLNTTPCNWNHYARRGLIIELYIASKEPTPKRKGAAQSLTKGDALYLLGAIKELQLAEQHLGTTDHVTMYSTFIKDAVAAIAEEIFDLYKGIK